MPQTATDAIRALIARYYAAFNAEDAAGMLACVTDDVEHRVNEGGIRRGRALFADFCAHMGVSYRERLEDMVILVAEDGSRAAAEFTVHGRYLVTDPGLPSGVTEARGQAYVLPAGAFFTLRDGRIARVSTFYNLADWIRQVSA
ncbi:MAG: nuclear transport factor 2 family protein [Gemmobacter sp.]